MWRSSLEVNYLIVASFFKSSIFHIRGRLSYKTSDPRKRSWKLLWLILNLVPQNQVVIKTLSWTELRVAAFMSTGHWLDMVELLVAVCATRFELWKVAINKLLAWTLLTKPDYFKIHIFSVCHNFIIWFIKARSIKLADKDGSVRVSFRCRIPIGC